MCMLRQEIVCVCVYVCTHALEGTYACAQTGMGEVGHKRPVKWLLNHKKELGTGSSIWVPEEPTNETFPGKFQHVTTCFTQLTLRAKSLLQQHKLMMHQDSQTLLYWWFSPWVDPRGATSSQVMMGSSEQKERSLPGHRRWGGRGEALSWLRLKFGYETTRPLRKWKNLSFHK